MDKKTTFKYASERERVRRTNKALFLGFAVVADQIRELAEKTKGETENIEQAKTKKLNIAEIFQKINACFEIVIYITDIMTI